MIDELVGLLARETGTAIEPDPDGGKVPGQGKLRFEPHTLQVWHGFGFTTRGRRLRYTGPDLSRATLEARACFDADYGTPSVFAQPVHGPPEEHGPPGKEPKQEHGPPPNPRVLRAQQLLGPVQVGAFDGRMGPHTRAALRRFQLKLGRLGKVTEEPDDLTMEYLRRARPTPTGLLARPVPHFEDESWVRQVLRASGRGPIRPYEPLGDTLVRIGQPEWFELSGLLPGSLRKGFLRREHAVAVGRGLYHDGIWRR